MALQTSPILDSKEQQFVITSLHVCGLSGLSRVVLLSHAVSFSWGLGLESSEVFFTNMSGSWARMDRIARGWWGISLSKWPFHPANLGILTWRWCQCSWTSYVATSYPCASQVFRWSDWRALACMWPELKWKKLEGCNSWLLGQNHSPSVLGLQERSGELLSMWVMVNLCFSNFKAHRSPLVVSDKCIVLCIHN